MASGLSLGCSGAECLAFAPSVHFGAASTPLYSVSFCVCSSVSSKHPLSVELILGRVENLTTPGEQQQCETQPCDQILRLRLFVGN